MAVQQLLFDILAKSDKVDKTFQDIVKSADTMSGKLGTAGRKAMAGVFSPKTAMAAGGAAGALLTTGLMNAVDLDTVTREMTAGLELNPAQSAAAGAAAGSLYKNAYGESMSEVGDAVETVMSTFDGMRNASEKNLTSMTGKAMSLAKTLETDVGEAAAAAGVMVSSGLAGDSAEAMDLLAAASTKVPKAMRGELIPILNEYSKDFEALGISGPNAMGLIVDAAQGGAIQIDKTGDALKEFLIKASDLEDKGAQDALKDLGLNSKTTAKDLLAGGDAAATATEKILTGLKGIKDPGKQASAAVALFGTPLEDIGKNKIPGFLDALTSADGGLGEFEESAHMLDQALSDGPGAGLKELQRTAETSLGEMAAAALPVLTPLLEKLTEFAPVIAPLALALGGLAVVIGIVNLVMAMSPITWIIVGVVALIAALVLLIANWDSVVAWITSVWGGFMAWLSGVTAGFVAGWLAVWGAVGTFLSGLWTSIVDGATTMLGNLIQFFVDLPGNILATLSGAGEWLVGVGKNMIDGLLNGISSMAGTIGGFFLNLLPDWIVGPFKAALGIHSPSKVFAGFGENLGEGVLVGTEKMAPAIDARMSDLVTVPDASVPDFGTMATPRAAAAPQAAGNVTYAPVFKVEGADADELFQKLWAKFRFEAQKEGLGVGRRA